MRMRNLIERAAGAAAVVALLPVFGAIAVAIRVFDSSPVLFRQTRIGRNGKQFSLLKFRTMCAAPGPPVTAAGDTRITPVGRFLRKLKLDELPQVLNVARGEMAFIGPRPELPEYVDLTDVRWIAVLSAKPGITDLATLMYRDEEDILSRVAEPAQAYRDTILPAKLALNLEHVRNRSLWSDVKLLALTVRWSFFPRGFAPHRVYRQITGKHYAG